MTSLQTKNKAESDFQFVVQIEANCWTKRSLGQHQSQSAQHTECEARVYPTNALLCGKHRILLRKK